jgi:hypothetical protein
MDPSIKVWLSALLKGAVVLFFLNEVRGFLLAAPILYGMYQAGGSLMAIWIGVCSLAGVALSVIAPALLGRHFQTRVGKASHAYIAS